MSSGNVFIGSGDPKFTSGVFVFAPSGGVFVQQQVLDATAAGNAFGAAVAVDGSTLLVGAPFAASPGAAFAFTLAATNGEPCASASDCLSGFCTDGVCCSVASCAAQGPCNAAGHCQAGTGTCTEQPINTGMPCAVDACSSEGTCQNGSCVAMTKVCPAADACHEFGACDPATGQCSNPPKPDGVACPTGTCMGGVCSHGNEVPNAGKSGCGCGVVGSPAGGALAALFALLLLVRRGRTGRASRAP
jgi:hypothetical protein